MRINKIVWISALLLAGIGSAQAKQLQVSLELPRLNVAEYHRPYVAIWVEDESQAARTSLAVWYQQSANNEGDGTKWLPDLRQWWRHLGRRLNVPVDGVTGATRPPGVHQLVFDESHPRLRTLPNGDYTLVVEAAREVGGREVLRVPFRWGQASRNSAQGSTELGRVQVLSQP